jgi:HPr kinase/phosphorylase
MEKSNVTLQGSFLNIFGTGTLITGEPGIGKSELAVALIERHHQLIADDVTDFELVDGKLIGKNPLPRPFLHLRGLGLFDISHLYGPRAIKASQELQLILELQDYSAQQLPDKCLRSLKDISGCLIPCETIPIIIPRNLVALTEIIVKRYLLNINQNWLANNSFEELLQQKMECNLS